MHVQLSFLEEKGDDDIVAVWSTLNDEQRAAVLATLTRVMAKLAVADPAQGAKENDHE